MANKAWVYFYRDQGRYVAPIRLDIGADINKAIADTLKEYEGIRKVVVSHVPDYYEDWDMQGEELKWEWDRIIGVGIVWYVAK